MAREMCEVLNLISPWGKKSWTRVQTVATLPCTCRGQDMMGRTLEYHVAQHDTHSTLSFPVMKCSGGHSFNTSNMRYVLENCDTMLFYVFHII